MASLAVPGEAKIVLFVLDGLGGLGAELGGRTALEAARTPNLDRLAREGTCGLHEPVGPGITPGSGPGHLALFGYDPLRYRVGRGVLSALGIDFPLRPGDVAARGNFCTLDASGEVSDRRAGRIASEKGRELCQRLRRSVDLPGVELHVEAVKEHRFLLVLRGDGLGADLSDTDPLEPGRAPREPEGADERSRHTAELVARFVRGAREALAGEERANGVLLRGFATLPDWPKLPAVTRMRLGCAAGYPMYRGVARLVGMDVLEVGPTLEDRFAAIGARWGDLDYAFVHEKGTDSAGEDGDFERKRARIEEVDAKLDHLLALEPDVIVVTGDHSTPSRLAAHSFHPVPLLIWAPRTGRPDDVDRFGERACMRGGLGPRLPGSAVMALALGHALRLRKFGA